MNIYIERGPRGHKSNSSLPCSYICPLHPAFLHMLTDWQRHRGPVGPGEITIPSVSLTLELGSGPGPRPGPGPNVGFHRLQDPDFAEVLTDLNSRELFWLSRGQLEIAVATEGRDPRQISGFITSRKSCDSECRGGGVSRPSGAFGAAAVRLGDGSGSGMLGTAQPFS